MSEGRKPKLDDDACGLLEGAAALEEQVDRLEALLEAILNTEIDWHDSPLKVRDLSAVQDALIKHG